MNHECLLTSYFTIIIEIFTIFIILQCDFTHSLYLCFSLSINLDEWTVVQGMKRRKRLMEQQGEI
jgi:hypothetical protein